MIFEIVAFKDLDGIHWKDQAGYFLGMGMTEDDMLKNKAAIYRVRIDGKVFKLTPVPDVREGEFWDKDGKVIVPPI